ncbi:MAG TPA: cobalamin-dependent protein, partial [Methanofastidiosum sp.]|nr:cobalamin-dependent protein [Methanofastidiosum sp.]
FVKKTIEEDADIVAISALMTTSMMYMEPVIKKLKENTAKAKVVIGGAPINNDFANKIGADGYGKDAVEAVKVSKKLVGA